MPWANNVDQCQLVAQMRLSSAYFVSFRFICLFGTVFSQVKCRQAQVHSSITVFRVLGLARLCLIFRWDFGAFCRMSPPNNCFSVCVTSITSNILSLFVLSVDKCSIWFVSPQVNYWQPLSVRGVVNARPLAAQALLINFPEKIRIFLENILPK